MITELSADAPIELIVQKVEKKTEKKAPPMLYNLAELQNDCSRLFKISPTDTLNTVQTLYERKLVTYPRTDARVLSTAVAKEIGKISVACRNTNRLHSMRSILCNRADTRVLPNPNMSMINRLPTTMRSFRPDRDLGI